MEPRKLTMMQEIEVEIELGEVFEEFDLDEVCKGLADHGNSIDEVLDAVKTAWDVDAGQIICELYEDEEEILSTILENINMDEDGIAKALCAVLSGDEAMCIARELITYATTAAPPKPVPLPPATCPGVVPMPAVLGTAHNQGQFAKARCPHCGRYHDIHITWLGMRPEGGIVCGLPLDDNYKPDPIIHEDVKMDVSQPMDSKVECARSVNP